MSLPSRPLAASSLRPPQLGDERLGLLRHKDRNGIPEARFRKLDIVLGHVLGRELVKRSRMPNRPDDLIDDVGFTAVAEKVGLEHWKASVQSSVVAIGRHYSGHGAIGKGCHTGKGKQGKK